jgi:DNA-binding HxlR family transcriptional regulator
MAANEESCTVCQHSIPGVVSVLSGKYAIGIVCAIGAHGTCRFGDLEDHFPSASTATLTNRLQELVAVGLLDRTRYREVPPRVEYELTADGTELRERCEPLFEWAIERRRS